MPEELSEVVVNPPEGWSLAVWTPELEIRLVRSYLPAIPDSLGVSGFLNVLRGSLVLIHALGWVAITDIKQGLTAQWHGAKWPGAGEVDVELVGLLRWVFERGRLLGMIGLVPSCASAAVAMCSRIGAQRTGIIPMQDTWSGEPSDMEIWFLPRR